MDESAINETLDAKPINEITEIKRNQDMEKDEKSSSESLIEVKLNEYVKRSDLSNLDIRALVVRCSACGHQINHKMRKAVKKHRKLGVITCKDCYEFYGSSEFSQDESGYNYCTWCGNGGKLIVCDFCPNGFCSTCIRRNFGRAEISVTTKEGWKCYCCDKTPLKHKVKFCNIILGFDKFVGRKEKKPRDLVTKSKNTLSEKWLQAVFDDTNKSCKMFHVKLGKLKAIEMSKSKSLKQVVKKMEEVINNHKADLKKIVNNLSQQYLSFISLQKKAEDERIHNIASVNDSNCNNQIPNKNKIIPPNADIDEDDCIIIENDISNISNFNKTEPFPNQVISDLAQTIQVDEKMKAKLLLLQSSSDSDSKTMILLEDKPFNNGLKSITNSNQKNNFSGVDSSSNLEDDNTNKLIESRKEKNIKIFPNSYDSKEGEISVQNDPKLKLKAAVCLMNCDHLFKEGETTINVVGDNSEDEETKLDKLINSLCKLPLRKRNNTGRKETRMRKNNKVSDPDEVPDEVSSSISLSSDDDENDKKLFDKAKDINMDFDFTIKTDQSDASSTEISSVSNEEVLKSRKKKKSNDVDNTSDEFQPQKKRKYDSLLHSKFLSDNENQMRKKEKRSKKRVLSSEEEKYQKPGKIADSSSESDEEIRKKAKSPSKKHKRIKNMDSSESEEDKKKFDDIPTGKGRKNIQKIISQKNLDEATKEAQLEEKERKRRIEERQKLYNKIEETVKDGVNVITRKMVLEVDQESKEEIVEIHPDLVCKLKPHQVNGVKFMWECTIESVKELKNPGSGCILAHCMGLGKTLQVIAFLHTCLNNPHVSKVIKRSMVICPYNTALNWASECDFWLDGIEGNVLIHQLAPCKSNIERFDVLKYWFDVGGIIIISYDIFRRLSSNKIPKLKSKSKEIMHTYLLDPGPDIVVCDEGHMLKNESSAISKATSKLKTRRRIILTGTPLQNNLKEYHCMLSFVKPNLLGTPKEFRNRFMHPIMNGQYDDSNEYDVKLMKKRIHILHKLLDGCVQRCDYSALTKFLSPKHEYVISVKLSEVQVEMYEYYLENLTKARKGNKTCGSTLFVDFNNLRCIWTHPFMCHLSHKRAEYKALFKDDLEEEFINDDTESSKSFSGSNSSEESDEIVKKYKTRSKVDEISDGEDQESPEEAKQWYHKYISEEDKYNIEISGKMQLLLEILKECEAIGDKIIVFSQSLLTLDTIEDVLHQFEMQPLTESDKDRGIIGSWTRGIDYFRMDGTTTADYRKNYIDMFNNPKNDKARLFLISTRSGSLGTNLVGANRVIVFDTSWNPSHDVQAIFRVYRFGQIKPVYIYRFLAQGTMEEKIYDRQVTKLSLACRVVDEQQIDRHFSAADLAELYQFDRNSTSNRPTPMVPKDRLLAELLIKKKDWIVTYHEHDSLLQSQTEEDLTEEERQAAWTEYENEREGRLPPPKPGTVDSDLLDLDREPDFTSIDYDGKMVPDLETIVKKLTHSLLAQGGGNNLDTRKKLLLAVYKTRQFYQEKHVKVLRMKQEYVARGSVPNTINKYLEELLLVLQSTGAYISKLQLNIQQEELIVNKQQNQFQEQMRLKMQQTLNNPSSILRQHMNQPQQPPFFRYGTHVNMSSLLNQRPNSFRPTLNEAVYSQNSKPPTIVEADETTSQTEPLNNSNKKTSVIIEEIP